MYIYVHIYVYICIYIYIHIYVYAQKITMDYPCLGKSDRKGVCKGYLQNITQIHTHQNRVIYAQNSPICAQDFCNVPLPQQNWLQGRLHIISFTSKHGSFA